MSTFYSSNDYRQYLEHHGVKGMRWGIRKERPSSGIRSKLITKIRRPKYEKAAGITDALARKNERTAVRAAKQLSEDRRRFPNDEKGETALMDKLFGKDWHDEKYMQEVWEISNPREYARESTAKYHKQLKNEIAQSKRDAAYWRTMTQKFLNTPADELTANDYKLAKSIARRGEQWAELWLAKHGESAA